MILKLSIFLISLVINTVSEMPKRKRPLCLSHTNTFTYIQTQHQEKSGTVHEPVATPHHVGQRVRGVRHVCLDNTWPCARLLGAFGLRALWDAASEVT